MTGLFDLARPFLHAMDAETAHQMGLKALKAGLYPADRSGDNPSLAVHAFGLDFPNPLGIAAGFDKNAEVPDAVLNLGCGFAEAGTVTPLPQAGNPKPRVFRLMDDGAVINRLGFNNDGHQAVLKRVLARGQRGIVGINIGANKTSEDMVADYVKGVELFAPHASYLTVNISSPNTPGLRGLQERGQLEDLIGRVCEARAKAQKKPPLLLKIAPDLIDEELNDIAEVVLASTVDGAIVSNTTIARPPLHSTHKQEAGGLSGEPLFTPSTRMLARFYQATGGKIPLIGVGGINSVDTAWEKFRAGATLIQLYTGLIFEGPGLPARIKTGLANRLRLEKHASIADITGSGVNEWAKK
jgi:dihydroorotate dehydrogenase